jgi:prepilin-type N-terminal cleavage/methylation domain-containing protein
MQIISETGEAQVMNNKAFTLMELMVVVVIVGIIAAFAIPNYTKANNKAEERQLITNLRAIISAEEVYKAQTGNYWPSGLSVPTANQGIAAINAALKLNLLGGAKYDYNCNSPANQSYQCFARYSPGVYAWQLYTSNAISKDPSVLNQVCCDVTSPQPCPTVVVCK